MTDPAPTVRKVFRYRVYPTPAQAARLRDWERALRFLWNLANEQWRMAVGRSKSERRYPALKQQRIELQDLRAALPWLDDLSYAACDEVLQDLQRAWQSCFQRLGRAPRFKRKDDAPPSIRAPMAASFRVADGRLVFPKLGAVEIRLHRPLEGAAKSCAIVRDVDQWFAMVNCELPAPPVAASTRPAVGIDRGVVQPIADSDGRTVAPIASLARLESRLERAQRATAHKKKGSRNRAKAAARVAKLYRKMRRVRTDGAGGSHQESRHYADRYGLVAVEKLAIGNMTRSAAGTAEEPGTNVAQKAGLNRAILGAGWGAFVTRLRYKLAWNGGRLVEVPPQGTSQTCPECGVVDPASRATRDRFACTACGHAADADTNAARNVLRRGLALAGAAPTPPKPSKKLGSVKNRRRKPAAADTAGGSPAKQPAEDRAP